MIRQIIKTSVFLLMIMLVVPVFAEDSNFYPEAVPGDNDQQPALDENQSNGVTRNSATNHDESHGQSLDANEPQLSLEEQHIIDQDQAQFDAALNTLGNKQNANTGYANEQSQPAEERQPGQQYSSNSQPTGGVKEPEGDAFFNSGVTEEQQNAQKSQTQQQANGGERDW